MILSIILLTSISISNYLFNLMNDYCERETDKPKKIKVHKIVDTKKTQTTMQNQLQVIAKILSAMSWLNSEMFADSVVYEISRFVFRNPISFTALVFKHVQNTKLKVDSRKSYIVVNSHFENYPLAQSESKEINFDFQKNRLSALKLQNRSSIEYRHVNRQKQDQYAINIKVVKVWKTCKINYENSSLRQIIAKSKHFIDFLKNIRIDNAKHENEFDQKMYDNGNFQEKQGKLYTLVCQNYDYIVNQIIKIQQNQKHKKLDHSIAKTYVEMMNKNILVLNVQKNNFNPISYKSEGKYLYFQNSLKLPLVSQKFIRIYSHLQSYQIGQSQLKLIPYLEFNKCEEQWQIKNSGEEAIQLFEQSGKQTDRGQGLIMDRQLNYYRYDDYVVEDL